MELACELPLPNHGEPDWEAVPDEPGVLLLSFAEGLPYLTRTAALRRRFKRLLRPRDQDSRWASIRDVVRRARYQPTGSNFESALLIYQLARHHRPDDYRRYLKLRNPPFVKVHLGNPYPRTYITRRLTRRRSLFFGPFVSRASAERFESAFLDLYKIRRCREELAPDPAHPGCIYGEMEMCLRPCQARSTPEQYHAEVGRVLEFLHTGGASLVRTLEQQRDQASADLEFEEADRQHRRLQKVRDALKLKDDLARDVDQFFGVVVQPSADEQAVELWVIYQGFLQSQRTLGFAVENGRPVSLDRKLRETLDTIEPTLGSPQERAEHLALLNRWYYSSWRKGELILFDGWDRVPYRRLVNAISRVAAARGSDRLWQPPVQGGRLESSSSMP